MPQTFSSFLLTFCTGMVLVGGAIFIIGLFLQMCVLFGDILGKKIRRKFGDY